jgi:hypothetical protein
MSEAHSPSSLPMEQAPRSFRACKIRRRAGSAMACNIRFSACSESAMEDSNRIASMVVNVRIRNRVSVGCHPEQVFFAQRRIWASRAMRRALCEAIITRLARFLIRTEPLANSADGRGRSSPIELRVEEIVSRYFFRIGLYPSPTNLPRASSASLISG